MDEGYREMGRIFSIVRERKILCKAFAFSRLKGCTQWASGVRRYMSRLPPWPVVWATARTTLLVWLVLRGVIGVGSGGPGVLLHTSLFTILGTGAVVVADVSRNRERLILANLAVGRRHVAAVCILLTTFLEVFTAVVLGMFRSGG